MSFVFHGLLLFCDFLYRKSQNKYFLIVNGYFYTLYLINK